MPSAKRRKKRKARRKQAPQQRESSANTAWEWGRLEGLGEESIPAERDKALWEAVRAGKVDDMRRAVAAGADINATDHDGRTAAMLAALHGKRDCLEYAVTAGCDINAKDEAMGMTAVLWAADTGHRECLEFAVAAGGDINARDMEGNTAAMVAAERGYRACLECAVTAGGDINAKNYYGQTAVMMAALAGNRDCLEYAIAAGGDINAKDEVMDRTAVLWAAERGYCECLEFAVAAGGDINAKNAEGDTAAILAAELGYRACLEYAVTAGGDINARNDRGRTAVMVAALNGNSDCLEFAAAAGGDINAKDRKGETAVTLALKSGHHSIAEWLQGAIPALSNETAAATAAPVPQEQLVEVDIATRLGSALEQPPAPVREAEADKGDGPLPAFLQRAMASIREYMADGGLAGAGLAARRGVVGSLREAAAEEAVRVAVAEWSEGSMRQVAEAVAARDEAVASEVGREGISARTRAQLEELQEVFKHSKQLMKQCVARRRAVAAADEAVEEARPLLGRVRRARLRGEVVEEEAVAAAKAAVTAAEEELCKAHRALERVQQVMREIQGVCPEVQCKLSWRASVDDGLEDMAELGDVEEAALLASISEHIGRVLCEIKGGTADDEGRHKAWSGEAMEVTSAGRYLAEWQYECENGKWVFYSEEEGRALEAAWLGERGVVPLGGGRLVRMAGPDGAVEVRSSGNGEGGRQLAVRRLAKSE